MDFKWIVLLSVLSETLSEKNLEGCLKQNTYGYGYLELFSVDLLTSPIPKGRAVDPKGHIYIEFYVKAASNAHILLSDSVDSTNVYEIVLGGGNNTFSEIRLGKGKTKKAKKSTKTEQILSADEPRGFWIELDTLGYILVGKIGEDMQILNWKNKNPFQVEYISVSTWANVRGRWYFACHKKLNPVSDRNLTAFERLRNDLFAYYNPTTVPHEEDETDRTVEMNLDVKQFHLDEIHGTLTLIGLSHLKWRDRRLLWDPKDYDGVERLSVSTHRVWAPDVKVLSSFMLAKKSLTRLGRDVIIGNDGTLQWWTPFFSKTFCALSLSNWPFGVHNCSLDFGYLPEPLKLDIKEMTLPKTKTSEWEMREVMKRSEHFDVLPSSNYFAHILVQRRNPAILRNIILPSYICAAVLSLLSFWMDPSSSSKLFLNSGSLSILIITLIGLTEILPKMTSTPEIVRFYSWSVLVMCVPVIVFIGLKYTPDYIKVPGLVVDILDSPVTQTLFCLPQVKSESNDFRQETEFNDTSRLFVLVERLIFWIYFTILVIPFLLNTIIYEQLY
ncbi:UNVERIFIED_CONTAM: hypothetical protein PYX00_003330 [Menopon gallinae]|uniref:Uncharacterized protein n=1 Tax=Menopon gallinae TaxID=328185 RepID=A0AAW2I1X5_9NEOP